MKNTIFLTALVASVLTLSACGAAPAPAPVVIAPAPAPAAVAAPGQSGDWVLDTLLPAYQTQYGNITLQTAVTVVGLNNAAVGQLAAATSYTWAQVYNEIIVKSVQNCNCVAQLPTTYANPAFWIGLNWNVYNSILANIVNVNSWSTSYVTFATAQTNGMQTVSFKYIMDDIIAKAYGMYGSSGLMYTVNPNMNYYGYGYPNTSNAYYYGNGTNVQGGLSYNGNSGSGGIQLYFGGSR